MVGTTKSTKTTKAAKTAVKKPKSTVKNSSVKTPAKPVEQPVSGARKFWTIALFIAIPVALGFISSLISGNMAEGYGDAFVNPPYAPPAWLFPVAWTILYVLMGLGSYFIFACTSRTKKEKRYRTAALVLYFLQLAINFAWSPVFFGAGNYFLALVMLLVMWLMLLVVMFLIRERCMPAMWCLFPYALWCLFAMYLNIGVFILN